MQLPWVVASALALASSASAQGTATSTFVVTPTPEPVFTGIELYLGGGCTGPVYLLPRPETGCYALSYDGYPPAVSAKSDYLAPGCRGMWLPHCARGEP